ncbi:MAG: hypothetical protein ACE5FH_00335 [Candidatus Zixiibacteriota bacterium]
MNAKDIKKLAEEIDEIGDSRNEFIDRHYLTIRDSYQNNYEWPELDPLRDEICLCITFGLCQAAIALTNHLMESLIKYALIISDGNEVKQTDEERSGTSVSSFVEKYSKGQEKYNDANLDTTINCACKKGKHTKDEKKQLHEFRKRFRNAYGHSDKKKIFGESTVPVTGMRFNHDTIVPDEEDEPRIADFMIGQGLIQATMAQNEAPQYFLYIDKLVRGIGSRLFNSKRTGLDQQIE